MGAVLGLLTSRQRSVVQHALLLWPIALVPSLVLAAAARATFTLVGADVEAISPPVRTVSLEFLFSSLVFAPVAETLLMSAGVALLSRLIAKPLLLAAVSGVLWGALHGSQGLLWFFGSAWSFFVFSCAYLVWKQQSYCAGFVVAAIPHALVNLTAVGLLSLDGLWSAR